MLEKEIRYCLLCVIAICVALFNSLCVYAQDWMDSMAIGTKNIRDTHFEEKIFMHVDRTFYVAGEICWYKIYVMESESPKLSTLSKVAYIEIFDQTGQVVDQQKVNIKNGLGNGSLYLPLSLNSGNYQMRAYTKWMRNRGPEVFFTQPITVVNPFEDARIKPPEGEDPYQINLFPEGGYLVAGMDCTVGIKVTDKKGRGPAFAGVVLNQNGDTLSEFTSLKFGMGRFQYQVPSQNITGKVILKIGDDVIETNLPETKMFGAVLHVEDENEEINISIDSNLGNKLPFAYLLVHRSHHLKKVIKLLLQDGHTDFKLNKKDLQPGVISFTLLNAEKEPLCERLYFHPPQNILNIEVDFEHRQYRNRDQFDLTMSLGNKPPFSGAANLSMAVFRVDSLALFDPFDIMGYYWLQADLPDIIESPGYYFQSNSDEVIIARDNLMLTQGWHRFEWRDMISGNELPVRFLPEYEGHMISARIKDLDSVDLAKSPKALFSVPGNLFQLYTSRIDDNGLVNFVTDSLYGNKELILIMNDVQDSVYRFEIVSPFEPEKNKINIPEIRLSTSKQGKLTERSTAMQVQNVYVKDSLDQFWISDQLEKSFLGSFDKTYLLDDYTRFPTMEEVMREFVPEVNVRKRREGFSFYIYQKHTNIFLEKPPLVLLDGIPIFDTNVVMEFDPLKINKLEIISERFALGGYPVCGVVSYSTYDNDRSWLSLDPANWTTTYEGLDRQRKFYSPVYTNPSQKNSPIPDFRTLLFWDPNIQLGREARGVRFYTGDLDGKYMGIIQGISNDGFMGSQHFTFQVINEGGD